MLEVKPPTDPKLVYYPAPVLRQVSQPVPGITDEIRDLVPKMFEVMRTARGIGLAGPQVAFPFRIIVASVLYDPEAGPVDEVYINPVIREKVGRIREDEGCLSLPGLFSAIERDEEITVEYTTLDGEQRTVTVSGLHSKLFQHEIDHLDGILMIDKMTPAELKNWTPLLRELEEDFQSDKPRERNPAQGEAAL